MLVCAADVSSESDVSAMYDEVRSVFGTRLGVVVANAAASGAMVACGAAVGVFTAISWLVVREPLLVQKITNVRRVMEVCQLGSYMVAQAGAKMVSHRRFVVGEPPITARSVI